MRSELLVLALGVSACTFGGLGDYPVETCARPAGTAPIQEVGDLGSAADLSLTSTRDQVVAAYAANVNGGACVQAVGARGFLSPSCSFLASELSTVPRQPSVLPFGAGYAAALVATTAPCTQGRILWILHGGELVETVDELVFAHLLVRALPRVAFAKRQRIVRVEC